MTKQLRLAANLALLALIYSGAVALAQNTNSGDIRGVVTDATGAVIPDAKITVLDIDKGVSKEFRSNDSGLYDTGPIVTGNYKLTFTKVGFSSFVRSSVTLEARTITIDAAMTAGSVTQEIIVTSDVPLIKTESGEQSTTLSSREMQKLPNAGQDWQNFVRLIPGATGTASYTGATGQALSVNGNLPYNAVLNDGASSALSHSGNADVSVFETVQEVQVNTSAFSAQFGIGGAVFNQISKGGSNAWHGSLYEYAQNDAFNARSYFQTTKPYLRFHNFGGSVSGPVLHDRAFFYFNYDQVINQSASTGFATVPTLAMRSGNFAGMAPIYNPATSVQVGSTINRTQYAGNQLPSLDPSALKTQALYPLPNVAGSVSPVTGLTSNNYYYSIRGTQPFKKYFGRFDFDITPKNRITGSVTKRDNPAFYPNALPCPINCYIGDVDSYNSQLTDVWNISPTFINEARFGYTNQLNFFTPQTLNKGYPSQLGIQFSKADILPTVNFPTNTYTGLAPGTSAIYKEHNFDPSDIVTLVRGKHVLHFGGEYLIFQDNSTAWGNINGATIGFTGTYTACTYCQTPAGGGLAATGNSYADFLQGNIQSWSAGVTPEFAGRQKAPQMFVQDDWKLLPNLTVNLGLRYQIMEGWSDAKKNQRIFDPNIMNAATNTPGAMWYAATAEGGRSQLQNNVYNTFLPRVGFAYQQRPGMVFRGGYGMYAYLWSLDTYGSGEGSAFGASGSKSDTTNGFTPFGSLSGVNPQFTYVNATTSNSAFNGQTASYNPRDLPVAKIHQYNFTIEQQIGANMSASIAYVGSRSVNLKFDRDINQVPENKLALASTNPQLQRPYPQFLAVTGSTYNAGANYNSLQFAIQRRLVRSVSFQASYVWSKFLDEYDSSAWGSRNGTANYQRSYDVMANYGPSNFDTRNAFKGNAIYILPFGHGQMFFNKNNFVDEVIGGWQLASTFVLQGGNPFTVTSPGTTFAQSGTVFPNYVKNPTLGTRTINKWFQTCYLDQNGNLPAALASSCTANDVAFSTPANGTFGNNRRNNVYGPGLAAFDLSLGKTFNLYKDIYKLQIRLDATNALNHPSFGLPNVALSNGAAGKITTTTIGGRNIQLGGRFSF